MKTSEQLKLVLADYNNHGEPVQIHLVWKDGTKAGIGNKKAIRVAMNAIINELNYQLKDAISQGL